METLVIPHTYERDPAIAAMHNNVAYRCRCGEVLVHEVHPHEPVRRAARGATDCVCGKPMDWAGHLR